MIKPRYSQLLSDRRRSLGLSLSQAARVLRLKEQTISAFEEGTWNKIPRSGYAQAMLSSYARYLGLKPHDVIELFEQDLAEYSASVAAGHIAEDVAPISSGDISNHPSFRKTREDLYGSAGPAGSILTKSVFDTTGPQPIAYASRSENKYETTGPITQHSTPFLPTSTQRATRTSDTLAKDTYENRKFGSTRQTYSSKRASASTTRSRISRTRDAHTYADDLHYDVAQPYQAAHTPEARSSMRANVQPERPNVRRRSGSNATQARTRPKRSGLAGVIDAWFSDPRRTTATVFVALGIMLLLIISLAITSCTTPRAQVGARIPVSSADTSQNSQQDQTDTSQNSAQPSTNSDSSSKSTSDNATPQPTSLTVEVSVDAGEVSWLEIKNGDKSVVAQTITGPWNQTFTVDSTMTIRANDPDSVHVVSNGKAVNFDSVASGIGTITLTVPKSATSQSSQNTQSASANTAVQKQQ